MGAIYKNGIAYSPHLTVDNSLSDTSLNPVENRVVNDALEHKVDKEDGKGLSTEDFTTEYKNKLDGIAVEANKYILPTASSTLGGVKTTSTVNSATGYTACPIISGVPYYQDTNTTYTHPTTAGNKHIPSGGSDGRYLAYEGHSGTAKWDVVNKLDCTLGRTVTDTNMDIIGDGKLRTYKATTSMTNHPGAYGHVFHTAWDNATTRNDAQLFIPNGYAVNSGMNIKFKCAYGNDNEWTDWIELARNSVATTSANGLMSKDDKTKLNGLSNYTHPTTAGNKHIPSGGSSGQILGYDSDGTAKWVNKPTIDSSLSASSENAVQNKVVKTALDGKSNTTHKHTVLYIDEIRGTEKVEVVAVHNNVENSPGYVFRPHTQRGDQNVTLGSPDYAWKIAYIGTGAVTSSDRKMKKDFAEFDDRYESFYEDLKPISYRFKNGDSGRIHSGFVSQDVEQALIDNELTALDFAGFCKNTITDENGNETEKYALRYEEFIALNTWQIQKLKSRVDVLEKENEDLKKRLDSLEERLSKVG